MCTVSIVPILGGVRVACNRDERRNRPSAFPPRVYALGRRRAVFPVDPLSGGTWIGVNDAGLVMAVLNKSADNRTGRVASCSRGDVIPSLLTHERLLGAVDAALGLPAADFDPFRLIIVQAGSAAVVTSGGRCLTSTFLKTNQPFVWTSSSLGDALVEPPRTALFDRVVREAPAADWRRRQNRFHRHHWQRHPEISVVMNRSDAATVSRTIVELVNGRATMAYQPLGDERLVVQQRLDRVA